MKPIALLVYIPDIKSGLEWYARAFPEARCVYFEDSDFTALDLNGFYIEIVQSDEKVRNGKFGTVLYWQVQDLIAAKLHFEQLGAKLYRGPLAIESNQGMCQLVDPFDNLIGLRGFYSGLQA